MAAKPIALKDAVSARSAWARGTRRPSVICRAPHTPDFPRGQPIKLFGRQDGSRRADLRHGVFRNVGCRAAVAQLARHKNEPHAVRPHGALSCVASFRLRSGRAAGQRVSSYVVREPSNQLALVMRLLSGCCSLVGRATAAPQIRGSASV